MEKGRRIQCVTCPKVFLKAKEIAKTKRLCVKENLVKIHFIPRERPQYKVDMTKGAPQVSYDNENVDNVPNLFNFGSLDACSTHTELIKGVAINGWDSDGKNHDEDCDTLDASSRDVLCENQTQTFKHSMQNREQYARIESENDDTSRRSYECYSNSNDQDASNSPHVLSAGIKDIPREEMTKKEEFAADHFLKTPMHANLSSVCHARDQQIVNEDGIAVGRSISSIDRCLEAGRYGTESNHAQVLESSTRSDTNIGMKHYEESQLDTREEDIKDISSQGEVNM